MAGTFTLGEKKVRPGAYFNIQRNDQDEGAGAVNGVTAVLFRADFGPLNQVVELNPETGYEGTFGTGGTTDAIREAFAGGASTVLACRIGNGGTASSVTLKDESDGDAVTITAMYPGRKEFAVSIRGKLADPTRKECIIYDGVAEYEKAEFAAGDNEAAALADAFAKSGKFRVEAVEGKGGAALADVSQSAFEGGTDPAVTNGSYSEAFGMVEAYDFNTVCVDTEDRQVHLLLAAFLNRVYDAGLLAMAVVAEKQEVDLDARISHAAAFNDNKMHYVLNAHVKEQELELDGYQTAARVAGMIAACQAGSSLTHAVVVGFTEVMERLTNTQVVEAEQGGCIVLTYNSSSQVWIDSAINTLVTPAENQDDGWRKIRRTKTRFELMRRMNMVADSLIGRVDNDNDGRAAVISQLQGVGIAMVDEGKLVSCAVSQNGAYVADGDSAWFDIDVVDKDSMEHIYLTFRFQYSTNVG